MPEKVDTLPEMVSSYLIEHVTDKDTDFYYYLRALMTELDPTQLRSTEYYMRLHTGFESGLDDGDLGIVLEPRWDRNELVDDYFLADHN